MRILLNTLILCLAFSGTLSLQQWHRKKLRHLGQTLTDKDVDTINNLSNDALFDSLLEPLLIPRVPQTNGHAVVQKHIVDTLTTLKWDVKYDSFQDVTPVGRINFTNIVATLNPDAPRHLVFACHYDSLKGREKEMVLATDSSVPCAMMLYLATILNSLLRSPRIDVPDLTFQLIFFDGEEAFVKWSNTDSLYGSRHLASVLEKSPYHPIDSDSKTNHLHRMDVMVLLDLIGCKQPAFYNYFTNTKTLYDTLVAIETRLKTMNRLSEHIEPYFKSEIMNGRIEDDHIPFIEKDVRVVHLIPYPFPWFWHTVEDNKSNLHFPTIYNLNKIFSVFIAEYMHLPVSSFVQL